MRLMFMGPPGAGKGTQAARIASRCDIAHISTGDMLREEIKKGTALGIEAKKYVDDGDFVPDDVIIAMVKERTKRTDAQKGFILEGFPRTTSQAEALEGFTTLDLVINIYVSDDKLIHRICGRRVCRECGATYHESMLDNQKICPRCKGSLYMREDDKEDIVKKRINVYKEKTRPLIEYYTQKGILHDVVGSGGIDNITEAIMAVVNMEK
ncbi:MAG: adenylate kinase [Christensenellales bacterium]|jgi:adenylate kinase